MQTVEEATKLCNQMISIGKLAEKDVVCVLTNMNEPLGINVGNSIEVIEATECLKGNISSDVKEVVCTLGSYMLEMAGFGTDIEANKRKIEEQIYNRKSLCKMERASWKARWTCRIYWRYFSFWESKIRNWSYS